MDMPLTINPDLLLPNVFDAMIESVKELTHFVILIIMLFFW